MANAITKTVQTTVGRSGGVVKQLYVTIDTVDTNLELGAATTGKTWYLLGLNYGLGAAHELTFQTNTDTICVYTLGAATASKDDIASGGRIFAKEGEALNFQSDTAGDFTITITDDQLVAFKG